LATLKATAGAKEVERRLRTDKILQNSETFLKYRPGGVFDGRNIQIAEALYIIRMKESKNVHPS
jgi:hypothetical protein